MHRTTKWGLVGVGIVTVMVLQVGATFAAYGAIEMTLFLAISGLLAFFLQILLFSHVRPLIAVASAAALALAGAFAGLFTAIRIYGS